jgi:hypothetical protein
VAPSAAVNISVESTLRHTPWNVTEAVCVTKSPKFDDHAWPFATELVLSVRSVENRLPRVSEKLGTCTRAALSQALNLTSPWEGVHQLVKTGVVWR